MDKDLSLNSMKHDLCEMKTFGNLLWEAIGSPYFTIFWTYLIINVSVLSYHILYKWYFQSMLQLKLHLHRIRKYIGYVIGAFSFSISWKVVFGIESCYSSIYLVLFSCLLGVMAYFITYGLKGTSNALFAHTIRFAGTFLFIFSVKNHFEAEEGQHYFAQSLYGIFLLVLGIKLVYMRDEGEHITEGYSWHGNGSPQLTVVVISD